MLSKCIFLQQSYDCASICVSRGKQTVDLSEQGLFSRHAAQAKLPAFLANQSHCIRDGHVLLHHRGTEISQIFQCNRPSLGNMLLDRWTLLIALF